MVENDYVAIETHDVTVKGGGAKPSTVRRTDLGRFLPPVITRNFCSGNVATGHNGSQVTCLGGGGVD